MSHYTLMIIEIVVNFLITVTLSFSEKISLQYMYDVARATQNAGCVSARSLDVNVVDAAEWAGRQASERASGG